MRDRKNYLRNEKGISVMYFTNMNLNGCNLLR